MHKFRSDKVHFSRAEVVRGDLFVRSRRVLFSEVKVQDQEWVEEPESETEDEPNDGIEPVDEAGLVRWKNLSRRLARISSYFFAPDLKKLHLCSLHAVLSCEDELSDRLVEDIFEEDSRVFHQKEYPHLYIILEDPSAPDFAKCMAYLRRQTTLCFAVDMFVSSLAPEKKKKKKVKVELEEPNNNDSNEKDSGISLTSSEIFNDVAITAKSGGDASKNAETRGFPCRFAGRSRRTALAGLQMAADTTDLNQTDVSHEVLKAKPSDATPGREELPNGHSANQQEIVRSSRRAPACLLLATRHFVFLFDMLKLPPELVWNILKPILEDGEVHKVVHNFAETDYYFLREDKNIFVKNLYDVTVAQKKLESKFNGLAISNNRYSLKDFRCCYEQYYQSFRTFPAADFVQNEAIWQHRKLPHRLSQMSSMHIRDVLKQVVYLDLIKRAQLELFMSKTLRLTSLKLMTVPLMAPCGAESFEINAKPAKTSNLMAGANDDDSDFE